MRNFLYFIPVLLGLLFISCSKKTVETDPTPTTDPVVPLTGKDETILNCFSVGWLGEPNEIFEDISKRTLSVTSDLCGKQLIFTEFNQLSAHENELSDAYDNGAIIVIMNPERDRLANYVGKHNWSYVAPADDDVLLVAYSKLGGYVMHKVPETPSKGTYSEQEDDSEEKEVIEDSAADGTYKDETTVDFTEFGYYCGPFIDWLNDTMLKMNVTPGFGSEGYFWRNQKNFNVEFKVRKLGGGSDPDVIKGVLPVIAYYVVRPEYLFSGQQAAGSTQGGDYYKMIVEYGYEIKSLDQGEKEGYLMSENRVHKHGAIEVWIKGAFMKKFEVKTYIDSKGKYKPEFIAQHTPIPETFIENKTYSATRGWNLEGGVDGGIGPAGGTPSLWGHANGSFKFGFNSSTTVSYTVADLSTTNVTTIDDKDYGSVPGWYFTCHNLPKNTAYTCGGETPKVAKSTKFFKTYWVWFVGGTPEKKVGPIGNIVTEFSATLGANTNGVWLKRKTHELTLDAISCKDTMLSLTRQPFGTIKIQNTWADSTITKVTVHAVDSKRKPLEISSDIIPFSNNEIHLEEERYNISLMVAGDDRIEHEYEMIPSYTPIKVTRRKNKDDVINISSVRFRRKN